MKLAEVLDISDDILSNDKIDLPDRQPTDKARELYPPEFLRHIMELRRESEALGLTDDAAVEERAAITRLLHSIDGSLSDIAKSLQIILKKNSKG